LKADGVTMVGPNEGDMACGEFGPGRMAEPMEIIAAIEAAFADGPLKGKRILVTSGPTHEPIDPVRYIANRSSGAQGSAIGAALAALGAEVVFVTGPADAPPPAGVEVIKVQSAAQMLEAVEAALPVEAAVFAAAVADWRVASESGSKIKKQNGKLPVLEFAENPDILARISQMS
ncbi:MAG: phosphopantothenoylcysteine decarboxylase, partial [Halocynthiibacter sp.]